ncbi:MAG TPA: TFIIB-type zinc ribbon-containing protein [Candidatus Limiplasma sp.]|nr:TFIIB-type zinc ribbon-containing protein [Candidatus Limiplasma sp.]
MAGVTYKCPNCGSYIAFNPDNQKWKCDSCGSVYDEKTLLAKAAEYQQQAELEHAQQEHDHDHSEAHSHTAAPEAEAEAAEPTGEAAGDSGTQVVYHCPSCGSEIMTDETTVATECYYCHNPVVLQGKLTADMKPDQVLPFSISKDKAVSRFMEWVAKKRFVPSGFFARDQVKQMQGVYYPHFVTRCLVNGSYEGEGLRSTVMDSGQYIVTTTEHFAITRRGDITFQNIMRPALKSTDRKLSDGIHPFPLDEVKPFSGAYLSGFLAERRDLTAAEATADVEEELNGYVSPLLTQTVHYTTYSGSATAAVRDRQSKYVLLPTWVLTYRKSGEKEPYYYVMNGRTGEVCGKLPINRGKLRLYGLGLAAICFAAYCVAAYFLF